MDLTILGTSYKQNEIIFVCIYCVLECIRKVNWTYTLQTDCTIPRTPSTGLSLHWPNIELCPLFLRSPESKGDFQVCFTSSSRGYKVPLQSSDALFVGTSVSATLKLQIAIDHSQARGSSEYDQNINVAALHHGQYQPKWMLQKICWRIRKMKKSNS